MSNISITFTTPITTAGDQPAAPANGD